MRAGHDHAHDHPGGDLVRYDQIRRWQDHVSFPRQITDPALDDDALHSLTAPGTGGVPHHLWPDPAMAVHTRETT